jgi:hypothetical protein
MVTAPAAATSRAAPPPQQRRMGEKAPTTGTYGRIPCSTGRKPPRSCHSH